MKELTEEQILVRDTTAYKALIAELLAADPIDRSELLNCVSLDYPVAE